MAHFDGKTKRITRLILQSNSVLCAIRVVMTSAYRRAKHTNPGIHNQLQLRQEMN